MSYTLKRLQAVCNHYDRVLKSGPSMDPSVFCSDPDFPISTNAIMLQVCSEDFLAR